MSRSASPSRADAGFTLIEVIVALALFALIAAAGAALVSTVLDTQRRTANRLERLGDIERTQALVARDLTEIADAPLVGIAAGVTFDRNRGSLGGGTSVAYLLIGDRLVRIAGGVPQRLLDHVAASRWQYLARPGGWQDHWPNDVTQARGWPAAVALDLDLAGPPPNGHLRRIVDLPVRPLPPGTATGQALPITAVTP